MIQKFSSNLIYILLEPSLVQRPGKENNDSHVDIGNDDTGSDDSNDDDTNNNIDNDDFDNNTGDDNGNNNDHELDDDEMMMIDGEIMNKDNEGVGEENEINDTTIKREAAIDLVRKRYIRNKQKKESIETISLNNTKDQHVT